MSDAEGVVRFRGFTGEYELSQTLPSGTRRSERFTLDRAAGMPLTLVLRHG